MRTEMSLLLLLLVTSGAIADEPAKPWQPPWWKSEPMSTANRVLQSPDPFVFLVRRFRPFATEAEANAFADKQPRVCDIRKITDDRYHVAYAEPMDVSILVPAEEIEPWQSPKGQFALFLALRRWYAHGDEIADGKFFHYQGVGHATAAEARARIADFGEIVELKENTQTGGVFARHRQAVDILAEAKPKLQMLELSYSDLIPENIEPYRTVGPVGVERLQVGVVGCGICKPGVLTAMDYLLRTQVGQGAEARVMVPDAADGLDHDFLRHFVLERDVKVIQRNGQTIITSNDGRGRAFTWKAASRRYYCLTGGDPEVVDAYLAKFPSVLPRDYAFDREAWLKEEVRQTMERLAKSAAEDAGNSYLTDYFYLCRFIEPIEGAPPIWPSFLPAEKLTAEECKAHYARVERRWKQQEKDSALRDGAPLSHAQMMKLSPKEAKAVEAALEVIRASVQPAGAPK